jgi:hypothetical protein
MPMLVVHEVGAFVASYVPSPRDWERLDPRFRLPAGVLHARGEYEGWGFAVFQLKPRGSRGGASTQTVHPMAFTFPTRKPRALYFPTLHVHDGDTVPARATYDHTLYLQSEDEVLTRTVAWRRSARPLGKSVDAKRARGLVAPKSLAYRRTLWGEDPNEDTWIDPPVCSGAHVLQGRGERFAFELGATAAYYSPSYDAQVMRWRATARARLDDLHAGMTAGLEELTRKMTDTWHLGRVPEKEGTLHRITLSNGRPHRFGPRGIEELPPGTRGPFEIEITASSTHVQHQTVRVVFEESPSVEVIASFERKLAEIMDRAVA